MNRQEFQNILLDFFERNGEPNRPQFSPPIESTTLESYPIASIIDRQFKYWIFEIVGGQDDAMLTIPNPHMYLTGLYFLHLGSITGVWQTLKKSIVGNPADFEFDGRIKQIAFNDRWIPFAWDEGSTTICCDYDPAITGQSGQVILVSSGTRAFIARCLDEFFNSLLDAMQSDSFSFHSEFGLTKKIQKGFPNAIVAP